MSADPERESEEEEEEDEEDGQQGAPDEEEKNKTLEDIRNPDVVTKYRLASEIANDAIKEVLKNAKPGRRVGELCELGDKFITEATDKIYNKGKLQKGIGFPTCISVNNVVGSFSPAPSDATELKGGDLVKVDLGVHIDGYLAMAAHTAVVEDGQPVTGRKADVLAAVFTAAECAIRMLRPGTKNTQLTRIIDKVAKQFGVNTVEGVFSHEVKRFEIDGEKVVANNIPEVPLSGENKTKECTFEAHEVWGLDIVMSTGSGKPAAMDERTTTVFKRLPEQTYKLKMQAPRAVLSEITKRFPHFPFNMRQLEFDAGKVRFGLVNCVKHDLLEPYPVLYEKEGEFVAHVKFTALLLPNGTMKASGLPFDLSKVKSEKTVQDQEVLDILKLPLSHKKSKAKKKKKKAKKPAAAAPAAAPAK